MIILLDLGLKKHHFRPDLCQAIVFINVYRLTPRSAFYSDLSSIIVYKLNINKLILIIKLNINKN